MDEAFFFYSANMSVNALMFPYKFIYNILYDITNLECLESTTIIV